MVLKTEAGVTVAGNGEIGELEAEYFGRARVSVYASGAVRATVVKGEPPGDVERLARWQRYGGEGVSLGEQTDRFRRSGGRGHRGENYSAEATAEVVQYKARARIREAVMRIGADHLVTLTTRSNVLELAASREHVQRFLRLVARGQDGNPLLWPHFVGVPERQKRGAWHWHFAVNGKQDIDRLRGCWWRALGERVQFSAKGRRMVPQLLDGVESPGNVDVQSFVGDPSMATIARYISKYIGKDLQGMTGGKASYIVSRGLPEVSRETVLTFARDLEEARALTVDELKARGFYVDRFVDWSDRGVSVISGHARRAARLVNAA